MQPSGRGRLLLGRESLLLQGLTISKVPSLLESTPESLMQDLAGNAMALPVVLAVAMATFAVVSWAAVAAADLPPASAADVEEALEVLELVLAAPAATAPPADVRRPSKNKQAAVQPRFWLPRLTCVLPSLAGVTQQQVAELGV